MSERTAKEIKAYCEAASQGPWHKNGFLGQRVYDDDSQCVLIAPARTFVCSEVVVAEANATFVVNAHEDLPALLKATWELYGMVATLYHEGATADMAADTVAECQRMIDEYARYGTDESGTCDYERLGGGR